MPPNSKGKDAGFGATRATVLDLPALEIGIDHWGPLDDALMDLEDFHWLVFSSANGVQSVQQRLQLKGSSLADRPRIFVSQQWAEKRLPVLEEIGAAADLFRPSSWQTA